MTLRIAEQLGDQWGQANRLGNMGIINFLLNNKEKAVELLEKGLKIYFKVGLGDSKMALDYKENIEFIKSQLD